MKAVGIATLVSGFNYGSVLQAFALREVIRDLGYEPRILTVKGSMIAGRDFRLGKMAVMLLRTLRHQALWKKVRHYLHWLRAEYPDGIKKKIDAFTGSRLDTTALSWRELKRLGKSEQYRAFVCGSDQIWEAAALYVNPVYYLRFCPREKRIAYGPSFAVDNVPRCNRRIVGNYVNGFDDLSTRELRGAEIIRELTGRDAPVVLDPTLLFDKNRWADFYACDAESVEGVRGAGGAYAVVFFLDKPNPAIREALSRCVNACAAGYAAAEGGNLTLIGITPERDYFRAFFDGLPMTFPELSPFEFLRCVAGARFVLTDSYHGTLFSLNFERDFWVFERDYARGENQSSRVRSILGLLALGKRYVTADDERDWTARVDFGPARDTLARKQEESLRYLKTCLEKRA